MARINEEGRINDHTYLIDGVHAGISRGYALYLLKSEDGGTCLIDAGTKDSAPIIYEKLKILDAWPVDKIIFTHSHWDHTQGIGFLRRKAAEAGFPPEVFASQKAAPYLADQSYNICFREDQAPFDPIADVTGLEDGDRIRVGRDLTVAILDTPGHMVDHISIWDEPAGTLFVGDSIGMKWSDRLIVPNPNSELWNEKDFLKAVHLFKSLDPEALCLAHFGCLNGEDARRFLDETVSYYHRWMEIFSAHTESLEDLPRLIPVFWEKIYGHIPEEHRPFIQPDLAEAVRLAAGAYVAQYTRKTAASEFHPFSHRE
jgi:glyoxylase-like metal-dependent hydrolase (beta-lactamase superfamily II)